MPTRQSKYGCAVSKQAVLFLANNVGGLLRHVVSCNDGRVGGSLRAGHALLARTFIVEISSLRENPDEAFPFHSPRHCEEASTKQSTHAFSWPWIAAGL